MRQIIGSTMTRVLGAIVILAMLSGCVSLRWNADSAVADAERDIRTGKVRFAYVGVWYASVPGVPENQHAILGRYGRLEVGSPGCLQDEQWHEYARRYNDTMWSYVAKQRRGEELGISCRSDSDADKDRLAK
jgi:hypothetical protein